MRSSAAVLLCLAFSHEANARVPHSFRDLIRRDAQTGPAFHSGNKVLGWLSKMFKRQEMMSASSTGEECFQDKWYNAVDDLGEDWCQDYMEYPNRTAYQEYTPTM